MFIEYSRWQCLLRGSNCVKQILHPAGATCQRIPQMTPTGVNTDTEKSMIISMNRYHQLYDALAGDVETLRQVQSRHADIHPDTIESIYRLKWQEELKRATHRLCQDSTMRRIYQQYLSKRGQYTTGAVLEDGSKTLVSISRSWKIPPCFIARIILRVFYLTHMVSPGQNDHIADPVRSKDDKGLKTFVRKALAEPELILGSLDPFLALNVRQCIACDDICSPQAESIKQAIGVEKEQELIKKLQEHKIDFMMEKGMRNLGFPKTPDVLLSVPIALDGSVINWIESKAFFGDPHQHDRYLKRQYWAYHNRFGPGLVIYWYGFVQELAAPLHQSGMLLRSNVDGFDIPGAIIRIEPIIPSLKCGHDDNQKESEKNSISFEAPPGFASRQGALGTSISEPS